MRYFEDDLWNDPRRFDINIVRELLFVADQKT
jgi:hypothetical protein